MEMIRSRTLRILSVSEVVLFAISRSEDVIAKSVHEQDERDTRVAELYRVEDEITRLERVHERHPSEISNCKHEAKTIGDDIHSCEDCRL